MDQAKKNKKEARDEKLKDQKIEEQILKTLEEAKTPEDKFQLLLSKYVESERLLRRSKQDTKALEKQLETVVREKENLQREYNKNVLMRDKLEEVCREQQKLIKSVKNESMQKIREEEERRKESQSKFQSSLNEINLSLNKNNEENNKLRDHNIEMTKKLKFLAEQYQAREQQLEKLNEQVQIEGQLHRAKLNKVQVESAMEKEILIKEKQIVLEKLLSTQQMLKEISDREKDLKEQLNLYTAKYDDFQSSLQKSNDIFVTYKTEMEKMSKNSRKLEKECLEWKRKWEKSNATLIELATEKKDRDDHAMRCNKQVEQLQKLLRALQNERSHLYKVIKENNVEVPPLPALPAEPEPMQTKPITSVADKDKMEIMSKNCAELKQTLANLQNQMKVLNLKGAEAEEQCKQLQVQEESIKKKQKKKPKSKKNQQNNVNAGNNKESSPANSEDTISVREEEQETPTAQENGNINGNENVSATEQQTAETPAESKEVVESPVEATAVPAVELKEETPANAPVEVVN
ncbi:alpha-taxilin [Musca domestica]|uniref:Alpha-taxilin n=1 Tax=Musca domestica TaxID=7370 RepID=A0A1I8MGS0_MUSDO|nr:alpha-taxilin [Musca domestica]XP_019891230.1 alpha-taxilin [Musca domestica]